MAIDPSILLSGQPFRMPDRGAIAERAFSLAQLSDQRAMQRMQLEQAQRAAQERQALEQVLPDLLSGNFSPEAVQRAVRARPEAGAGVLKYVDERRKAQVEQEAKQAETYSKMTEAKLKIADKFANEADWLSDHPLLDDPVAGPKMVSAFQQKIASAGLEKILTTVPFQDWNNPTAARRGLKAAGSMFYDIKDRIAQAETERAHRATEAGQAAQRTETERFHTGTLGLQASGQRQQMEIAKMGDARQRELAQLQREQGLAQRAEKPLTEVQGNATAFAMRMRDARKTLDELEASGEVHPASVGVAMAGQQGIVGTPVNWAIGKLAPKAQVYEQAKRNWISANLRKESGAAIPPAELEQETRKWFPVVGDSPETIESKRQARETAEQAIIVQAGPGAKNVPPAEPFEQIKGRAAKPKGGGVSVTAPDGKTYTFPNEAKAMEFKARAGML